MNRWYQPTSPLLLASLLRKRSEAKKREERSEKKEARRKKREEAERLNNKRISNEKKDHPGTKLMLPARLPTSPSTSKEFHSQVRDGLAWFHLSIEHQSFSGAKLRRFCSSLLLASFFSLLCFAKEAKQRSEEAKRRKKRICLNWSKSIGL